MPRLFVPNVTFEHELSPHRQTLPKRVRRLCSELAGMWLAVAEEADWIWCPEPVEAEFWSRMEAQRCPRVHGSGPTSPPPAGLKLVPWGWSDEVRTLAGVINAGVAAPPQAVVALTNSRMFSFAAEAAWRCGLAGSALVSTTTDLEAALSSLSPDGRWVLKCEHGAAARERILGQGSLPRPQAMSWIRARLTNGGRLFFEPWVDRVSEAGLQWDIPESGTPELLGITPLLCNDGGNYLGSRFGATSEGGRNWADAIEISLRAAERIQQAGYFGPVGIDAMRYRDAHGELRLRPLQDINARWTMGRIALGWRRLTPSGIWRHGNAEDLTSAPGRIVETSPRLVDGSPVEHCTWIEAG